MPVENKEIKEILERVPEKPGIYQYFDVEKTLLYVGKAKNLKRRVSSYFSKDHTDSPKTRILVRKIADIKYIIVENEEDALLLENNLIKEFKPRYNILLKDDKTYPSISIRKEPFPRIIITRNRIKDGSTYFGPYSSVPMVKAIVHTLRKIYPIRTCKLAMLDEDIQRGKYKACLEFHIHKCKAPCLGYQSKDEYQANIHEIKEILNGNIRKVSQQLEKEMSEYAERLEFEKAHEIKKKYDLIESFRSKSTIANTNIGSIEAYTYSETEKRAYINHINVVNGNIVRAITLEYQKKFEEEKESIFSTAIYQIRQFYGSQCKEIIVPFLPEIQIKGIDYSIPKSGDRKKIIELSEKNVQQYKIDAEKQLEKINTEQRYMRVLKRVKEDLSLHEIPFHIECFDNSNIQGTHPVSSCVVFKNAKPSKKDYRHFSVKTVEGPNDYASMEEVVFRRYKRMMDEKQKLPQLIVIDGGKGQLSAAIKGLHLAGIQGHIPIIGIAKNLEEIYYENNSIPLYLDKNSETLRLIQQLRDEAHRFGITFHRKLRSKDQIHSQLDEIKGIGPATKKSLLEAFRSIQVVKRKSIEELAAVVGTQKAETIYNALNKDRKQ
jgi:excinuclease ABC subunit C